MPQVKEYCYGPKTGGIEGTNGSAKQHKKTIDFDSVRHIMSKHDGEVQRNRKG